MRLIRTFMLSFVLIVTAAAGSTVKTLTINTAKGAFEFQVEMAATEQERERGLMFRNVLPEGTGMLFDFHSERPVTFWMKNTYVPLDMIFIRSDGTVASVGKGVPLSEALVESEEPVLGVLEVIAGTAQKIGLRLGDKVHHPIFAN